MAKIYANVAGEILQFLQSPAQEAAFPNPPEGSAYSLSFDEETNAGVIAAYNVNSNGFAMVGGTLTQSGVPVTINPPGSNRAALELLPQVIAKLSTNDPLTTAETKAVLRVLLQREGLV